MISGSDLPAKFRTARRILFLAAGGRHSTSYQRAMALQRCGYDVEILDIAQVKPTSLWGRHWHRLTGYALLQKKVAQFIATATADSKYDLAWVDSGYLVGRLVMQTLRLRADHVINYHNDDPTGNRDGNSWRSFNAVISEYDLLVTVRDVTAAELRDKGARQVWRVYMSYDEMAHAPIALSEEDRARWGSEVLFVGTWMPERGPFMRHLIAAGIPVAIYGVRWGKAKEWDDLKAHWRGSALYGANYVKAVQSAKICLGLLSKGNRDQNTQRSAEIPAIGGLLCAERTPEHLAMFKENEEAVFWTDAEECVHQCRRLLADPAERVRIVAAGHRRIRELGLGNEIVMGGVIERFFAESVQCR